MIISLYLLVYNQQSTCICVVEKLTHIQFCCSMHRKKEFWLFLLLCLDILEGNLGRKILIVFSSWVHCAGTLGIHTLAQCVTLHASVPIIHCQSYMIIVWMTTLLHINTVVLMMSLQHRFLKTSYVYNYLIYQPGNLQIKLPLRMY